MPFIQKDEIRYYTFELLSETKLIHAVFTRRGGVSPAPWDSLNLGGTVGDLSAHVQENRERAFHSIGRNISTIYDVWQIHGSEVFRTDSPRQLNIPHRKADAILTDRSFVTLLMRFADCVPILLYDPRRQVIGLVHAGWMGTVKRTVKEAIRTMEVEYGSRPGDIMAGIGPSIGPHHYQVGPDVVKQVIASFGQDSTQFLSNKNGAVQFNLWEANRMILAEAGVKDIEVAGICTACNLDDWYSHRGENGRTGRFGVLIGLAE